MLSRAWELVPEGVLGELYIGGEGVAQGYLNRAELTAERFIPDGLSGATGARLYATGDVVRRRGGTEAKLEYLGRDDQQVKVRGYRIEVGEVELALCKHEGVKECVVAAQEESTGELRLVAYVVGEAEAENESSWGELNAGQMRDHLREQLPPYMIPTMYVEMKALPLTLNGKVDRKRLKETESRQRAPEAEDREKSDVKSVVAGIWEEVLKVASAGPGGKFLRVGWSFVDGDPGHVSRAEGVCGGANVADDVRISHGGGLAGCIEIAMRDGESVNIPPIELFCERALATLLRPAASLVFGPVDSGQRFLQSPRCRSFSRATGCERPRDGL